jgi:hypothetical protein
MVAMAAFYSPTKWTESKSQEELSLTTRRAPLAVNELGSCAPSAFVVWVFFMLLIIFGADIVTISDMPASAKP